jgi:alkanesulfonate monooxygenase SsuD/methylene tetrahydromethanopterin reductase-like flavin-dependent oxidoreductase (luciferase family)
VEFGLFFINEKAPGASDGEVMRNAFEQCRVADELGFDVLWLGEHHFAPYGTMADTMVFAGAVSQLTQRIAIGTAVVVPAFQHPVRIAEQVAMLDLMSEGRFRLGVGRGYQQREFNGFRIPHEQSTARFQEAVTIIDGLLHQDSFSYDGQFWHIEGLTIAPRPARRVPIYVAVSRTPSSYDFIAERDYIPIIGNPYAQDPEIGRGQEQYVAALRRAGRPVSLESAWGGFSNILVHEDTERAGELFHRTWQVGNDYLLRYAKVVEDGQPLPADYEAFAGWFDWLKAEEYDAVLAQDISLIGSPDLVVERFCRAHEEYGLGNYLIWMNRGGCIAQKDLLHSMELFATEVMPKVRHLRAATPSQPGPVRISHDRRGESC